MKKLDYHIKGTEVPGWVVLDYFAKGYRKSDILKRLPSLSEKKIDWFINELRKRVLSRQGKLR